MVREADDVICDNAFKYSEWAQAYAILRLAQAVEKCAIQLKYLGNGDAATQMGAIEALSKTIGEKMDRITDVAAKAHEDWFAQL